MNEDATALVSEARAALAAGRWSSALASFRSLLDQSEDADARFGLGIGLFWTGETVAAIREWERAYVVYRRTGSHPQAVLASGYLCLAYQMSMGNDAAARGWLARAARLVADHKLADMKSWLLVCRAHLAVDAGHLLEAQAWAREAADLARAAGDPDLELCALSELGAAIVEQGRVEEGSTLLDEAMAGALAGEGRSLDSVVLVTCRSIAAFSRAGDLRRATQWVRAADAFYRRYGSPHLFTTCRTHYGGILVAAGKWEEAERELNAAMKIGAAGEPLLHAQALAKLAEMRVAQGNLEEATRLLAGHDDHPEASYAFALIRLAEGQAAAARAILRRRLREASDDSLDAAALHELLVEADIALGAWDEAAKRATELSRRGSRATVEAVHARGERAVGRVLLAKSQTTEARDYLERAANTFARIEMPIEVARTRLLLAAALAASDREAAAAEARAAFAAFDEAGALREADAAAALLRSLGTRAIRTGQRAIGLLTRREREVLALLGAGLSNPEIGQRLFISRKTVEHHVANVLAKVGLSGRGEAAAYAVRYLERDSAQK